ncbi:hypothetical protein [Curtobacterium sp. MCJR17_043]|uniref:hypothetical protein n=1 Tax=Curtobacterium sp. MCJR17_043 TaxID=2175660 RepID=UPI0032E85891
MPKTSTGATAPKRGEQVGADDPVAADRLVDDGAEALELAGVQSTGVDDAVFDDGGPGRAAVPHQGVPVRHVRDRHVVPVPERVQAVGYVDAWSVVLDEDGREVRPPEEPLRDREFLRSLQDHQVHAGVGDVFGCDLDGVRPPSPGHHGRGPNRHAPGWSG